MKNALLPAGYLVFVTAANVLLKGSADAGGGWPYYTLLAAGNIAGLVGILAYTGLLRTLPLHVAYPLTEGLSAIGVQVVGSALILRERIPARAWAGTCLILSGIVLFSL